MIRVLNVVTIMNRAGLESRLMDIYRRIDRSKIQFDFYTNRIEDGDFDEEINALEGRVFKSKPIAAGHERRKIVEFRQFLENHREYQIIHSHVNELSTIFLKSAKYANVPIRIAHSRGANTTPSIRTLYKNIVKISINKYATNRFAVSKEAAVHLFGRRAFDSGEVRVIPNAIDVNDFRFDSLIRQEMRDALGIGDSMTLIHVGNLNPVKNHQYLLKVFADVLHRKPESRLILVGEGSERKHIEELSNKLGIKDSILMLGKRDDVPRLLLAADVFVFPSFHEGFPGAVLEAQASGLPCIISDTITKEIDLTNSISRISIKESPNIWAERIILDVQKKRADNIREIIESGYDIDALVKTMEGIYCNMLNRSQNEL